VKLSKDLEREDGRGGAGPFDEKDFELIDIIPENVPLILKRFKIFRKSDSKITSSFNSNLNSLGTKIWNALLKMPPDSFLRKQFSHLSLYLLRKR
jgi:hypothetical protein